MIKLELVECSVSVCFVMAIKSPIKIISLNGIIVNSISSAVNNTSDIKKCFLEQGRV